MSTVLAVTSGLLVGSAVSVLTTVAVLTLRVRRRYAGLPFFRCRVRPTTAGRRRGHARWCLRRTQAAWVDDVLLVRSGALRWWLTPLSLVVARDVTVQALRPGEVRGLGPHPVVLRFSPRDAGDLEIAVAAEDAERLAGPFLTAALRELPDARQERGG